MKTRHENETVVIFRKWKKSFDQDQGIVALFPYICEGSYCGSYAHLGQHGQANYNHCIDSSRPATPDDYADLKEELEEIGYNLKVAKRRHWKHSMN